MNLRNSISCLTALLLSAISVHALNNGLALTPPMGWMSWERYRCIIDCDAYPDECISENLFKKAADRLVADGYKNHGYEYVIIDDCWMERERDASGRLVPDRKRFPSGMKALADYVSETRRFSLWRRIIHFLLQIHSKGLKFGIYEDYGTHTCAGYPGIIGHMEIDAQTFADWDVDYVKLDGCYADIRDMDQGYPEFGRLLNQTGRPMIYSCSWPVYQEDQGLTVSKNAIVDEYFVFKFVILCSRTTSSWNSTAIYGATGKTLMTLGNRFASSQTTFRQINHVFNHMLHLVIGTIRICWSLAITAWQLNRAKLKWQYGQFSPLRWSCQIIFTTFNPSSNRFYKIRELFCALCMRLLCAYWLVNCHSNLEQSSQWIKIH